MSNTGYMLHICYNRIMEITTTKEELKQKLELYFLEDFIKTLESSELDEDEKEANMVLSKKKRKADAEGLADMIFKAYGID
jgi:hypothetical protein